MAEFTYFIISPGFEIKSYVQYPDKKKGNYIKFGDQKSSHVDHEGIRGQYMTHNPDIGIAAVMDSSVFTGPYLGTRLKKFIMAEIKLNPVGTTEWFSVSNDAAWKLFHEMLKWDRKTLTSNDFEKLTKIIRTCLS